MIIVIIIVHAVYLYIYIYIHSIHTHTTHVTAVIFVAVVVIGKTSQWGWAVAAVTVSSSLCLLDTAADGQWRMVARAWDTRTRVARRRSKQPLPPLYSVVICSVRRACDRLLFMYTPIVQHVIISCRSEFLNLYMMPTYIRYILFSKVQDKWTGAIQIFDGVRKTHEYHSFIIWYEIRRYA